MSTEKITLPIRYWDQGPTRRISPTDENKRTLESCLLFLSTVHWLFKALSTTTTLFLSGQETLSSDEREVHVSQ